MNETQNTSIDPATLKAMREAEEIMNNALVPTDSRIIWPNPEYLLRAIDEAAHIISSVGTTGIHDKTKQAQQWLEKYT
jgi:hypothetical protein